MKELKFLLIYIVLIVPTVLFGQGKIDRLVEEQFSFEENSDDSPEGNSDDSPDLLGNKVAEYKTHTLQKMGLIMSHL